MAHKTGRYIKAEKIFTGTEWLENKAVKVSEGRIVSILSATDAAVTDPVNAYMLAPAFADLQIYGAYGKLLSVYPEAASLHLLCQYCSEGGAAYFQPTVATNSMDVFFACIDAVKKYWEEGGRGCLGLHIEGPWIHPSKKGAHLESFIHSPTLEEAEKLLEYGRGVISMITLAPEVCSKEVIALIQSYGVIVSAGHSNASYDEATIAFDAGIGAATHLYNAMSPLQHRSPGMVGAVFNHSKVKASLVPDGHHVDFAAIRIAKKIMGERLFVITDAVTETVSGPYPHQLAGDKYESGGILSGSALNMIKCVHKLVNNAGIELGEALRMASFYPAVLMKKDGAWGKIETGYEASLVMLDPDLKATLLDFH